LVAKIDFIILRDRSKMDPRNPRSPLHGEWQNLSSSLQWEQKKRIVKVWEEEYYLLDSEISENELVMKVSGSTQSVYTITVDKHSGMIKCDCPDFSTFAARAGCMCKHCCFVVIKVCKWLQSFSGWVTHKFDRLDVALLAQRLTERNLQDERIVNVRLQQRYEAIKNQLATTSLNTSSATQQKVALTPFDVPEELTFTDSDDCPICYDSLANGKVKCCPTCHNFVHYTCIVKWLTTKTNCVLCRSEVWKTFKQSEYQNKPDRQKQSNYLKL
jgi:hypothetical protein